MVYVISSSGLLRAPSSYVEGSPKKERRHVQRIAAVNTAEATGKAKELLDGVQAKLGMTPNLMRTLASGPAALEAYLNFGAALGTGHLDAKFREQIALAVAQTEVDFPVVSVATA